MVVLGGANPLEDSPLSSLAIVLWSNNHFLLGEKIALIPLIFKNNKITKFSNDPVKMYYVYVTKSVWQPTFDYP